ncbi:MAG: acyltransferase [Lachnospiraceae bacterium]|nr:acyltransferase [Lachnospiraceae bacterium]
MENGMTKKQSAIMQGVAIWMMLYHHLYSYVTEYESVLPFMQPDVVRRIAWFCKICVGIFAFVSGYGMYYGMERQPRERFFGRMFAEYRCVLLRILKLYGKLWLVLLIFMCVFFGILKRPFTPELFWGNLTAFNPTYNAAWWYVEQYAKMLLVLPLFDLLLTRFDRAEETKKKRLFYAALVIVCLIVIFVGKLWLPVLWNGLLAAGRGLRISFLMIFIVGYVIARYRVYQRADHLLQGLGSRLSVCLSVALIGMVIALRVALATGPAYGRTDFLLTPLLIYGLLTVCSHARALETFFAWWGMQSTYIWLVHGFVYEKAFLFVKSYVKLDLPGYLAALAVSAAAAVLLGALERLPGRWIRNRHS